MDPFTFENSTKVYFGPGCVGQNLPRLLGEYGPKVLLGYGGGSIKKNGIYDGVIGILTASGKTVTEFRGIGANPTYKKVQEGVALVKEQDIDFILAVGGGSVMDCCKAVALSARCGGNAWERFWAHRGQIDFVPVPLGVIVTLPATGSEVNGNAVVTNEADRIKTDWDYPQCNAKFALLDPVYTYTLPSDQLAAGSFDILSHLMETYFSKPDEDNVSDSISEALMSSVIRNLRLARLNPENYVARSNIMWCASMAENRIIKLGKKLDFQCHQIEHQLSAYTNCNHGKGLAVLHPVYYRHIYPFGLSKFKSFAVKVMGVNPRGKTDKRVAEAGLEALAAFIKELQLPTSLRELGLTDESILPEIAASVNLMPGCYKKMTREEILTILQECW